MIAKLIVRGSDRTEAIQKLKAALEEYEIVGPATNIEFLKRVCENPAFVAGEVETGFIPKHKDQLLKATTTPPEIYAQGAIAVLMRDSLLLDPERRVPFGSSLGFSDIIQSHQFRFTAEPATAGKEIEEIVIEVDQLSSHDFNVKVKDTAFSAIKNTFDHQSSTLSSFFPHTRLDTRLIFDDDKITVFSRGNRYSLHIPTPKWLEKALGVKDLTHSVLAPMPCKVLRVDVKAGDEVKKDQALVVIESMKMETTIRSPQDGIIARVVHKQGVSDVELVGATALISV